MRLKKNIYVRSAVAALALAVASCSDSYLDETIFSSYGTSVTDVNAKILGLHYKVGEILGYSDHQGYAGIWQDGTDVGAPGDVEGVETPFYKYAQLTSENDGVAFLWNKLYSIINAANQILADEETPTEEQYAEARFFRAYAYDQLVTGWGRVPLLTDPVSAPKTDFTRNAISEVDAVIEEDLEYAINYLPTVDNLVNESRISNDAARMLAGIAYLRMARRDETSNASSYFNKAVSVLTPIISEGNYSLISARYGQYTSESGDYYHDMFRYGNQRRSEGNTEGIWTFEMEYDTNVSGGTIDAPQQRRNWVAAFHKLDGMVNADSIGGRGNGRLRLSNYVKYSLFEDGDIRNSNYNIRRVLYYNNASWEGATYYLDTNGFRVENDDPTDGYASTVTVGYGDKVYCHCSDTLNVMYPYTTKWGGYDTTDDFGWAVVKDFPMMRFAEVYLLRAEAYQGLGETTKAAADINVLRDRAFQDYRSLVDSSAGVVSASDIDLNFILDERIREMVGEENRRFTLMRTGELANRVDMMVSKYPETTSSKAIEGFDANKHILLPIPLTEIQLNKDADLEQNPGY